MTQTLFLANCRAILVAIIAYCAGRGWLTPADSGALTAVLVPIGALVGPWIWIIYANINAKLVPHDSVAISPEHVMTRANPVGSTAMVGDSAGSVVAAKVVGALLAAFVLSFLLAGSPALAQSGARRPAQPQQQGPVLTGDLINDAKNGFKGDPNDPTAGIRLTGNLKKDAEALWAKIQAAALVDLQYASAMAGAAGTNGSAIRKQCWDAIIVVNQQSNGASLHDANGQPLTKPDPHLFTDVETAAEILDNLSPQGKLFTSCAGAAQLAQANVIQFISAAIAGAAGMAKLAPIPGLG